MGFSQGFVPWILVLLFLVSCGSSVTQVDVEEEEKPQAETVELSDPARLHSMDETGEGAIGSRPDPLEGCSLDADLPSDVASDAGVELLHSLGQEKILERDGAKAVAILAKAHRKEPEDAQILGDLATALLQCRLYDEALSRAEKAVEIDPGDVDIAANLAQTYQIAGRLDQALRAYRRALKMAPKDPGVYNNLAVLLVLSDLDEAEKAAREAVRLAPGKATYLVNLGYILFRKKRLVDAEMILKRAIDVDPGSADAFNQLGLVLAAQKRNNKATESFRKALELNPNHMAANENLHAMDQGFDFLGPWDKK